VVVYAWDCGESCEDMGAKWDVKRRRRGIRLGNKLEARMRNDMRRRVRLSGIDGKFGLT